MNRDLSETPQIQSSDTECEADMIYNEDDVTSYASMIGSLINWYVTTDNEANGSDTECEAGNDIQRR